MSAPPTGSNVAPTRQNPANALTAAPGPPPPRAAGGVNSPAPIGCANVIVVSGNVSDARLSQVAAAAGTESAVATQPTIKIIRISFLRISVRLSQRAD